MSRPPGAGGAVDVDVVDGQLLRERGGRIGDARPAPADGEVQGHEEGMVEHPGRAGGEVAGCQGQVARVVDEP
jgi:hypothetical protein